METLLIVDKILTAPVNFGKPAVLLKLLGAVVVHILICVPHKQPIYLNQHYILHPSQNIR
jgi:hypothetical protein